MESVIADINERLQLADLEALGIDWDEPPARQSERLPLYEDALNALRGQGRLYPCFCTRAEIREAASAPHGRLPEGSYPGTCRALSVAERRRRLAVGRPFAPDAPLTIYASGVRNAFDLLFTSDGKLYAPTNGSAAGGNTPGG